MALYLYMNFMYSIDTIIRSSLFLNGAAFQFPSMLCFIHLYYVKMSFKSIENNLTSVQSNETSNKNLFAVINLEHGVKI